MAADRNRRWRRAIPLLLVLLGLFGGFLLGRMAPAGRGHGSGERLVHRLSSELGLSTEQIARLNVIVEENHAEASAFREESVRRYREMRLRYREQIRALLDPEQLERFESMIQETDRRHRRRSGRGREPRP